MSVELALADPVFPQLEIAGDPESMREVFQEPLRPLDGKIYHIKECRLSRMRYRRGSRKPSWRPAKGCRRFFPTPGVTLARQDRNPGGEARATLADGSDNPRKPTHV